MRIQCITVNAVNDGGNDNRKLNGRKFSFINASLDQSYVPYPSQSYIQFGNILKCKLKAEINELTRAIELYSNGKKTCNPLTLDALLLGFVNKWKGASCSSKRKCHTSSSIHS